MMAKDEPRFEIHFDFDGEDEPPTVCIWDNENHADVAEVFEEPTCTADAWSWDSDDWEPGPLAAMILAAMNREAENANG